MYFAFRQAGLNIERRRRGKLRVRSAALHFVDEVEQRRILRACVARVESRPDVAECRRRPEPRRFVGRGEALREARQLCKTPDRNQIGPDCRHVVVATWRGVLCERYVDDRQTLRPILGLHKVHAVDHRIADLAMCVSDDHEIRLWIDVRQSRRIVFRSHARRVVARFAEAAVNQDDLYVGALALQPGERRSSRAGDPSHAHFAAELCAIPQHRPWCCESGDADLHRAPRQHDGFGE